MVEGVARACSAAIKAEVKLGAGRLAQTVSCVVLLKKEAETSQGSTKVGQLLTNRQHVARRDAEKRRAGGRRVLGGGVLSAMIASVT